MGQEYIFFALVTLTVSNERITVMRHTPMLPGPRFFTSIQLCEKDPRNSELSLHGEEMGRNSLKLFTFNLIPWFRRN